MKYETLDHLLLHELRDLHSAETQLVKALPKMAQAAHNSQLKSALESHLTETKGQQERLEQIFALLGEAPKGETCKAMKGLIEEGSDWLEQDAAPAVKDAGIIASAQRVEHYEMAAYSSAHAFAKLLGHDPIASLLAETLAQEKAADDKLTTLAETTVNQQAAKR